MKEYKTINGEQALVPETLKDVTVQQLMDFSELGELGNDFDSMSKLLNVLTGFTIKDFYFSDFMEITSIVSKLLSTPPADEAITDFDLFGVHYKARKLEEFSAAEFMDFDTLSAEPMRNLPTLLALIFIDHEDENYIDGVQRRANEFLCLDAETAQRALVFFSKAFLEYAKSIVSSLDQENPTVKEMKKMLNL